MAFIEKNIDGVVFTVSTLLHTPHAFTTRLGGVSTRDVEARKKLNVEIVKANRVNGYACWWPMLLPKYAIKVWEVILPKIGLMK